MSDVLTKVGKLREVYLSNEDQKNLTDVERSIRRAIVESELAERSEVQSIVTDAENKVRDISNLLSWDEKLTLEERLALFRAREVHMFWLERLDGTRAAALLRSIEKGVDSKLEEAGN